MEWTLRELRTLVAAADAGTFTGAAAQLYVSQAAVSRTIAGLEKAVGAKLLRRSVHGCELTSVGHQVLPQVRKVLAEAERLTDFLESRPSYLRVGYAWAALGQHTSRLQREWSQRHKGEHLELVRHNSPTAGLAEGLCDVAVTRRALDDDRFASVVVGLERRLAAFASDDTEWQRRRQLTMAEIAERVVLVDPRVGTTSTDLWHESGRTPQTIETGDVDTWLDAIVAGRGVGTTSEATAHHHPRPGVTYRPIKDGPRIPVRLVWWRDVRPSGLSELIDTVTALYAKA